MNIKAHDVITLSDNKEYVVVSIVLFENQQFAYLIDINNYQNVKFVLASSNYVIELKDVDLIKTLIPRFLALNNNNI